METYLLPGRSSFLSSKWEGEHAVREEFPNAIIFRPSDIYSHHDNYVTYYVSQWRWNFFMFPVWKAGRGIFKAPVYVSDVAKAVVKSIFEKGNEGETYQAVGPRLYELIELLKFIKRICEREYIFTDMRLDPLFLAKASHIYIYICRSLHTWRLFCIIFLGCLLLILTNSSLTRCRPP